jgi:hypothetical protein
METEQAVHLPHPTSCSKFFKCFLGVAYLEVCPSGLHFSTQLDRCDYIEIAGCKLQNSNKYFLQETTGGSQQPKLNIEIQQPEFDVQDFSHNQPEETYVEFNVPIQPFNPHYQPEIAAEYETTYHNGHQEFSNVQSETTNVEYNVPALHQPEDHPEIVISEHPQPIEIIESIVQSPEREPQSIPNIYFHVSNPFKNNK